MKAQLILALVAFGVLLGGEGDAAASSLAEVSAWFAGGASDVATVAFGCNVVNGQLVCGNKKDDNGDDADDDTDQGSHKKKKKHQDTDTGSDDGLTSCTIQSPIGGSGCSVGFKHVCEKLKNGKKCCGCVPDKNAGGTPATTKFCCSAKMTAPGDGPNTVRGDNVCLATQAEAEQGIKDDAQKNNWTIDGAISCHPAQ